MTILTRVSSSALLAALLVSPVRGEILLNPEGWKFPNIITSVKEAIRISDRTPLIPGKETILKGYRKADGTFFMTYEIEGRVFGVEVDTNGKPPFEYSIMDADGDGRHETKILHTKDNKDRGYVPQWVIDYYYSRHPEMKNPSGPVKPIPPTLLVDPPQIEPKPPPPKEVVPPPEALEQPNP